MESDSNLDPIALSQVRALLRKPERRERLWPVIGAAALCAAASLGLATAMILMPPQWSSTDQQTTLGARP